MKIEFITKQNRIDALEAALQTSENHNAALTSLLIHTTVGVVGSFITVKTAKAIQVNIRDSYQERKAARKLTSSDVAKNFAQEMVKAQAEYQATFGVESVPAHIQAVQ